MKSLSILVILSVDARLGIYSRVICKHISTWRVSDLESVEKHISTHYREVISPIQSLYIHRQSPLFSLFIKENCTFRIFPIHCSHSSNTLFTTFAEWFLLFHNSFHCQSFIVYFLLFLTKLLYYSFLTPFLTCLMASFCSLSCWVCYFLCFSWIVVFVFVIVSSLPFDSSIFALLLTVCFPDFLPVFQPELSAIFLLAFPFWIVSNFSEEWPEEREQKS